MVEIQLKNRQNGYDAVGEYIRRYWEHHVVDDVIVHIGYSSDGVNYEFSKEVACPYSCFGVEFLNDWWEGEKYIRVFGIMAISDVVVPENY